MDENVKFLDNSKPEECFILKNGRILKNLYELTNALTSMDDETFGHHVNKEKNDFANWIKYVFKNEKLADWVSRRKSREGILKTVNKWLSIVNKENRKNEEDEKKKFNLFSIKKQQKAKAAGKTADIAADKTADIIVSPLNDEKSIEVNRAEKGGEAYSREFAGKINEILLKEKELEKREEKILEVEERIEKRLSKEIVIVNTKPTFFSKEFVQGLVTGLLITLIAALIYIKFFY